MSAVPKAIRLAAWLTEGAFYKMTLGDVESAGRELRRLYESNLEFLELLEQSTAYTSCQSWSPSLTKEIEEAIAKATGATT